MKPEEISEQITNAYNKGNKNPVPIEQVKELVKQTIKCLNKQVFVKMDDGHIVWPKESQEEKELREKLEAFMETPEFKEAYKQRMRDQDQYQINVSLEMLKRMPQYEGMSDAEIMDKLQEIGKKGIVK